MQKVFDRILYTENVNNQTYYQTKPYTLHDFFAGVQSLRIPDYQRPYSWSKSNVKDLLKDIENIREDNSASWFIGSLFVLKVAGPSIDLTLLDGQQRSTTIQLIALAAFKHAEVLKEQANQRALSVLKNQLQSIFATSNLEAKFYPIELIRDVYLELVVEWTSCVSEDKFVDVERNFFAKCKAMSQESGHQTAITLSDNFKEVLRWFQKIDSFQILEEFCDAFLHRIWLIQIPMHSDSETVKIFEGLNNRGKALSLVDKLRFRCLIIRDLNQDETRRIKSKWGDIFKLFSRLSESHIIKSEDDFFKIFFNSIDGIDRNKNEQFFGQFDDLFSTRDGVFLFLDRVINLLEVFVCIENPSSETNLILNNVSNSRRRNAKAYLHVLYSTIRCSANSRFLLAKSIYEQERFESGIEFFLMDSWEILKTVINQELGERIPPNEIRTDYLKKCENTDESFSEKVKFDENEVIGSLKNFIFQEGQQQNRSRLLLTVYAYAKSPRALTVFNHQEIRKAEVDHLIPRAWKQHWPDSINVTKEQIINEFETLSEDFSSLRVSEFAQFIQQSDIELKFKDYVTLPHTKEKQLVEFIGNRWLLSEKINKASSNGDFPTKREAYTSVGHRIPVDDDKIGILAYPNFGWVDACRRSLTLIDEIRDKLDSSSWFENGD